MKLEVNSLYTLHMVKTMILRTAGVSVSNLSIIYAGRKLDDQKTLAFYKIKDQSIVEILTPPFSDFC